MKREGRGVLHLDKYSPHKVVCSVGRGEKKRKKRKDEKKREKEKERRKTTERKENQQFSD